MVKDIREQQHTAQITTHFFGDLNHLPIAVPALVVLRILLDCSIGITIDLLEEMIHGVCFLANALGITT